MPEVNSVDFKISSINPRFPWFSDVPAAYASVAPCRGSISGRIMDNGKPVVGALVVLMNRAGYSDFFSPVARTVSGAAGEYDFKNIPEWLKYAVVAEFLNDSKNSVVEDYITPVVTQ